MRVVGIDGGLADLGWAAIEIFPVSNASKVTSPKVIGLGCVRTKKSDKKANLLSSEDIVRRLREIYQKLSTVLDSADAVCMESMSLPRNAGSAAKIGAAFGAVCAMLETRHLPLVQMSPQAVRKALVGDMRASEEEIYAHLRSYYGNPKLGMDLTRGAIDHAMDALAVITACLPTSDVLRAMLRV